MEILNRRKCPGLLRLRLRLLCTCRMRHLGRWNAWNAEMQGLEGWTGRAEKISRVHAAGRIDTNPNPTPPLNSNRRTAGQLPAAMT